MSEERPAPTRLIPIALRAHFEFEFAPSALLEYDPEAYDLPEIAAALATIRAWSTDSSLPWRQEWAAAEWERVNAAAVQRRAQPQAGKALDRELHAEFDGIVAYLGRLPAGSHVVLGRAAKGNRAGYRMGPIVAFRRPTAESLPAHDSATPYRLLAEMYGMTEANVRTRISRHRDLSGEKLRRDPRGRGRTRVPARP
ncbi:MAG TPA: hypothetical protein PK569_22360 [Thermoanaerobaculia bacterium]|nr:hypothetical protein [Thermoanaerobaculia bacterium]